MDLIQGFRCKRCGHEWRPRDISVLPQTCPNCKSPYWNSPRQEDIEPVACMWQAEELTNKTVKFALKRRGKVIEGQGWFSAVRVGADRLHIEINQPRLPDSPVPEKLVLTQAEAQAIETYDGRGWRFSCCPPI